MKSLCANPYRNPPSAHSLFDGCSVVKQSVFSDGSGDGGFHQRLHSENRANLDSRMRWHVFAARMVHSERRIVSAAFNAKEIGKSPPLALGNRQAPLALKLPLRKQLPYHVFMRDYIREQKAIGRPLNVARAETHEEVHLYFHVPFDTQVACEFVGAVRPSPKVFLEVGTPKPMINRCSGFDPILGVVDCRVAGGNSHDHEIALVGVAGWWDMSKSSGCSEASLKQRT